MELKDFIKETIVQIYEGVNEAKEALKESEVIINAPLDKESKSVDMVHGHRKYQVIEFNLSVTTEEKEGNKQGIGIAASFLSAGVSRDKENNGISINTIKFSIPISLPQDIETKQKQTRTYMPRVT